MDSLKNKTGKQVNKEMPYKLTRYPIGQILLMLFSDWLKFKGQRFHPFVTFLCYIT